jgi:predicted NAD/FAD-binding protein
VGSGVAGLTAAYVLQRRSDVTLYEASDRLGGHAHTHDIPTADAGAVAVDSGFIVFNEKTYPLLNRLFVELGVESRPADMSMSIRCQGCGLEYAGGKGPGGVLANRHSAFRPAFLRMLLDVTRFFRLARDLLSNGDDTVTLRQFLVSRRFSPYFVHHFVIPVVSCVWSAAPGEAALYPARYLFTFLENHGMLSLRSTSPWRTVAGGSRTYVQRIAKNLASVATSTPVRAVIRSEGGVQIREDSGRVERFDRAVIATHADTALRLLARPTEGERSTLGSFRYSVNETWLHCDEDLLPSAPRARASWNYLMPACDGAWGRVLASYDMNRLQAVSSRTRCIVTLNATDRIAPDRVMARMRYEHPVYDSRSVAAQSRLGELNDGTIAFAGAYHGWGFHEDGCRSGVAAAASFGAAW